MCVIIKITKERKKGCKKGILKGREKETGALNHRGGLVGIVYVQAVVIESLIKEGFHAGISNALSVEQL